VRNILPVEAEEPALPLSGTAVLLGVLVAYGAFAVLISVVAAFANGAHANQQLSTASWKQLGVGGGIVAAVVLFVAWGLGGFAAARLAGRDGVRHGVWVFVVGVVLMTVVGAAITWLPDTADILKNLRLLGLPVRRTEWRDIGNVAGIASLVGMAAGAVVGGWRAAPALAPVAPAAPAAAPPLPAPLPEPFEAEPFEEEVPEPAFVGPSLFEQEQVLFEPEPEPEPVPEPEPEPIVAETPAWLQFVQERERTIHDRDRESAGEDFPAPAPAPWSEPEPAPTFIEEPELVEPERGPAPETAEAGSWWPQEPEPEPAAEPAPAIDEAWALPDEERPPAGGPEPDAQSAFPPPPPTPVPEPDVAPDALVPPPPAEPDERRDDEELFQAPPQRPDEGALQQAPEAPLPELDPEEQAERRRQQEEAARAYEQAREQE